MAKYSPYFDSFFSFITRAFMLIKERKKILDLTAVSYKARGALCFSVT